MSRTISRIAGVLISLVFVFALFPGFKIKAAEIVDQGECGTDDSNVTWTLESDGTLTISGTGGMKDSAFYENDDIKKVVIEDGVTSIGADAFSNCSSLTSITIPNSVTSIGSWAFNLCTRLTSITIPNSVTSIGSYAFIGCRRLTSITIPNSVTSIGTQTFANCTSLTSITIPNSVTSIRNLAFQNCTSLTSITIPNSVKSIGSAFSGCTSLTSITIPNSVTVIGNRTFENCTSLTSITIPDGVTSIGDYAFYGCISLTSITIPNSVTSIGGFAFQDCTSLTSLKINKKLYEKFKDFDAFYGISSDVIDYYYNATYETSTTGGSIRVNAKTYETDEIIITPDQHYSVDKVLFTVKDKNGNVVEKELSPVNGKYLMPDYDFNNWTGDCKVTASFKPVEYEITFKNYDGTVLEKKKVPEGEIPEYTGTITPEKPSAGGYSFEFAGWDTAPVAVTGPATYIAVYDKKEIEYEITFKNYDDIVLESKKVFYGETPSYTGKVTPTKPSDGAYSYEFKGWEPELAVVTGPTTYTATYTRKEIEYKVTFVDYDGVEICSDTVKYHEVPVFNGNTTPVRKETDTHTFTFVGWSDGKTTYSLDQGLPQIESDTTFSPVFDPVVKPVYTVGEVKGDGINSDIVIDVHRNVDDENCLTDFLSATIDGTEMKINDQYTATKGSTIITIKKDFLSTLPAGEHEVQVVFNDGSISTKVTIAAKASVPSTGEVIGPATYIGLALIVTACVCGTGVVLLKKRKKA